MSRVAIKDLFWEISNDKYASNVWDGYKDIEVVPRKMVEMIIAYCQDNKTKQSDKKDKYPEYWEYHSGKFDGFYDVKDYAESLLEKFENDGEV